MQKVYTWPMSRYSLKKNGIGSVFTEIFTDRQTYKQSLTLIFFKGGIYTKNPICTYYKFFLKIGTIGLLYRRSMNKQEY